MSKTNNSTGQNDGPGREIWTLAECDPAGGSIGVVSFEVIARAVALKGKLPGSRVVAVLLTGEIDDDVVRRLIRRGADEVIHARHAALDATCADAHARVLAELIGRRSPWIVLAAATTYGRTIMPYVASRVNAGLTADCTVLEIDAATDQLLQTRPAIGGNIMATIRTPVARPQMATVRPHSSEMLDEDSERGGPVTVVAPDDALVRSRLEFIGRDENEADDVGIGDAELVVAGGRGLKKAENFSLVFDLASRLGASVGASREAVDRGWISYPHQVGLSGKTINPRLYVALGISGSIQHLAGMQTAEHIIAIDQDPDAQIFSVANVAVQGDLFSIVPLLCERLDSMHGGAR
ncbi:MAG: electron transfer flavoprotein subunit alpha/FixB family protein [Spirochaetaceae bacterium]|nr:MAG: electron transfer flavoprotein subunit alpha/FixB family protein [Spirochaetaceae bacterium]